MILFLKSFINRLLKSFLFILLLSIVTIPHAEKLIYAQDSSSFFSEHPFLVVEKMTNETNADFIVIDAQILDDRQLEALSPALIAPVALTVSPEPYNSMSKYEYADCVCFKKCHASNDFLAEEYSEKQWRMLIKEDGHAVFSKIKWENLNKKETICRYLVDRAIRNGPKPEGIGQWD